MSLAVSWLLNLTGISALLVWASIGFISIRFRRAYKAQNKNLSDLPYCQPLFPLLPVGIVVLATLMFIAQGYAAVREDPFEAKNVVATYIGVALYIVLYSGYTLYERFHLKLQTHFVPLLDIDFDTDAVWKQGEGEVIKARDRAEREIKREEEKRLNGGRKMSLASVIRYVY